MKKVITCICLSLCLANFAISGEKETDISQSLSKKLMELHKNMKIKSVDVRKKALKAILPTKADIKVLFPEDADMLWSKLEAYYKNMIRHIDEVADELTRREWTKIKTIDVRKSDVSKRYEKVLKIIPKNIPVFRVIKESKQGSAGSSSYLFINGRWIHIQGLEEIPEIIDQIKNKK